MWESKPFRWPASCQDAFLTCNFSDKLDFRWRSLGQSVETQGQLFDFCHSFQPYSGKEHFVRLKWTIAWQRLRLIIRFCTAEMLKWQWVSMMVWDYRAEMLKWQRMRVMVWFVQLSWMTDGMSDVGVLRMCIWAKVYFQVPFMLHRGSIFWGTVA